MSDLNVKLKFEEIHFPQSDQLRLEIEVLGQIFLQTHNVIFTGNETTDIKRHKAEVFALMLSNIAYDIILQAKYGSPSEFTIGNYKGTRF